MDAGTIVIVTAHDEADRLPDTLAALATAFPGARVLVADDGSSDATPLVAAAGGAEVVRSERTIGKGGAATLAARRVLHRALEPDPPVFVLCDGDLAESAAQLPALAAAVRSGRCDLAVAVFAARLGAASASPWASPIARSAASRVLTSRPRSPASARS